MANYRTIDKTGWFIQHMMSDWLSRKEIVEIAAREFPSTPVKTLDGTIGQYWSDSVNPNWGTHKAIQARGLRVVESAGRRHIVGRDGGFAVCEAGDNHAACGAWSAPTTPIVDTQSRGHAAREMWSSNDPRLWQNALNRYWTFVKPSNFALEQEMDQLDAETVRMMDPQAWYRFLLDKYFRWKYTSPNRYASTTKVFRSYEADNSLSHLHGVKERIIALDKEDIQQCLCIASSVRGLGTAGASGLLAVLFPSHFGTVDQFLVKALAAIPELRERALLSAMNPESLKLNEGACLIRIMRRKAEELNRGSSSVKWTPRKVDMVLWSCAR